MFQDEGLFKPLQAADILGWQIQNQMRRTVMMGLPTSTAAHPGLRVLLGNRSVKCRILRNSTIRETFCSTETLPAKAWEKWEDIPFRDRAIIGKAGSVY